MEIASAPRSGSVVATLREARLARGDFTFGALLQIDWADRVAITGANGAGKSTLLAALLERLPLDSGTPRSVRGSWSARWTRPASCSSGRSRCWTRSVRPCPTWNRPMSAPLLAKFGLRADHVMRPATSLSPGERTCAALALLQGRGVNLLVLDEPTNHLDLPAIEQLEAALRRYTGTLLLVTHDRRMLEAVRTTRRIEVADGQIKEV